MRSSNALRAWLSAFGAAVPVIVLQIAILSIPLAAATQMGLSPEELGSWIVVLNGLPGVMSLILAYRYRLPLRFTGNVFILIFFVSLNGRHDFSELVGASMLAGACVVVISVLGLTGRLADLIPVPIVLGLLAGAVLPWVVDIFTMFDSEPAIVGGTFVAYLWGSRYLGARLPAILPALIAGVAIAAITGQLGNLPASIPAPSLVATGPEFSFEAIVTVTPVLVVLLILQSNVPSMVFLRSERYQPPERTLNLVSGASSAIGSLFGPTGVSLSLPSTSLVAGPAAGDPRFRYRVAYIAAGATLLIALLSGIAADLPTIVPTELLMTLAGLAVVSMLSHALRQITQGPLTLGPLFAFVITLSDMSVLGFGPFFWALVIGTGVSLLLEQDALRQVRATTAWHSPAVDQTSNVDIATH